MPTTCTHGPSAPTRGYVTERRGHVSVSPATKESLVSALCVLTTAMTTAHAGLRSCWRRWRGGPTHSPGTRSSMWDVCVTRATVDQRVTCVSVHLLGTLSMGMVTKQVVTAPEEESATMQWVCAHASLDSMEPDANIRLP